ncbi:MAG: zinc-ribbon domain-containing protein [Blastocatellia bacterium]
MICAKCGAENREGSNFCRYCSAPLTQQGQGPASGYIPSVPPPPPPGTSAPSNFYTPPTSYQTPPRPPARTVVPPLLCRRCNSASVVKGTIPLWAVLVAVIGAPFTCLLSLLFLLVKDPHKCLTCGLEFK